MQIAFPDGGGTSQHDLALCHSAKKSEKSVRRKWNKGYLLELNPIENSWGIIKNKLRSNNCTTFNKLVEAIISVWYHDEKTTKNCQKLVSSMPKRVKKVLKNKEIIYRVKCKNCFVF